MTIETIEIKTVEKINLSRTFHNSLVKAALHAAPQTHSDILTVVYVLMIQ